MNHPMCHRPRTAALVLGCAAALSALATACNRGPSGAVPTPAAPRTVPVSVAPATREDVPVQVNAIGWVEAYASVTIKPQVAGQITEIGFVDGQNVKTGDLLYAIDARPFVAALRLAEANLLRNKALAEDAEREARRLADLFAQDMAADRERDQARATADAATAQVKADEAAVDDAKLRLEYCSIRSPIDGRVGARLVDRGTIVKANEAELVTIHQLSPIYVTFSVAERHLPAIRERMTAASLRVDARFADDADPSASGYLTFIDNEVDQTTGMVRLRATIENKDHRLWPGRFVNAALTVTTREDAVLVPSQAVQTGQRGPFLFVLRDDRTVEMREVTVGPVLETQTVIESGLEVGEVVVTDGQLRLAPGARVEIKGDAGPSRSGQVEGGS